MVLFDAVGAPAPSRPLSIHCPAIPQLFGKDVLEPLKLSGYEGINSMFEYRLILQTSEAAKHTGLQGNLLQLNRFTGHEICCAIELDGHGSFVPGMPGTSGLANRGAGTRYIGGFIETTIFHGEDNHQALFEFVLRPWLHVACLQSDRRIFQNITAVDAIRAILSRYPYACEYRLSGEYPVRDYIVQYGETDHQFTTRLMQDCGINYHFEHRANGHCLVLSDHPGAFTPLQTSDPDSAYHRIPYYPPGHKIDREYLYAFTPVASITSDQTATRDFDYTQPNAT